MTIFLIITAGIGGTFLMTAFAYLLSYITRQQLKVVKVLGTMLTGQTTSEKKCSESPTAITTGLIAHYFVGVLFSAVYIILWKNNTLPTTVMTSIILGFVTGLFAMLVWRIFLALHPNPPVLHLKLYLLSIGTSHILFGFGVYAIYTSLYKHI